MIVIWRLFASDTITEVCSFVLGAEELKLQSTVVGRGLDERWMALDDPRKVRCSLRLTFLLQTKMWTRTCWIPCGTVMIGVTRSGATWFRTHTIVSVRAIVSLAGETQF